MFKSEDDRNKAVCFSQFLVTGEMPETESELVLNKVLCGVPINDSVQIITEVTGRGSKFNGRIASINK